MRPCQKCNAVKVYFAYLRAPNLRFGTLRMNTLVLQHMNRCLFTCCTAQSKTRALQAMGVNPRLPTGSWTRTHRHGRGNGKNKYRSDLIERQTLDTVIYPLCCIRSLGAEAPAWQSVKTILYGHIRGGCRGKVLNNVTCHVMNERIK